MWWLAMTLAWWCGASAIPSPGAGSDQWKCPEISQQPTVECSCDMPHTLRCTGDRFAMRIIAKTLRSKASSVSLLDCAVQNVTSITEPLLNGVSLHGLVVSSGEIREIHSTAFQGLASPLQALGLPNNELTSIPTEALESLPELDRLDLSGNKMKTLDGNSFKGLRNLSFVDLSNNVLSKLSPNTFDKLPQLRILRLRGNQLTVAVINKLNSLPTVEEFDLSENSLIGPLGMKTFPKMETLKDLQLSHNSLSSIKMGALQGLTNLTSLRLPHNQIDVIEDHAFIYLTKLVSLDLAHNRIVAVSGNSLSHLTKLKDLDLRHNFLRAVTADLVLPLKNLKNINLDDNDISIVSGDALKSSTTFKHFTLSENPLNCDCSLVEFAVWLSNSTLSVDDKSTAVCTTPPSLENGLLVEILPENLVCGEDEQEALPLSRPYKAKVYLRDFHYDGNRVTLQWNVEEEASPYTCDAIYVYEEEGPNEVLVESNPLRCNSTESPDPAVLDVTVPQAIQLQPHHRYRYCVVLFESSKTDDVSLVIGCSDVISLETTSTAKPPRVLSIQANLSDAGNLSIFVDVFPRIECELNVAILDQNSLISQRTTNCTRSEYTFVGLGGGPYRVCANVVSDSGRARCVSVTKRETRSALSSLDVAFVSVVAVLCVTVAGLVWGVRRVLLKPKVQTHQCFLAPDCQEQTQHNRYLKLQATTKL